MKRFFVLLFTVFFSSVCFAQSADYVTKILDSKESTYGQVSYLVSVYKNLVPETATEQEAVESLVNSGLIKKNINAEKTIRADEAAFLFAKIWKFDSSMMFKLSKGSPRYAFKQFKADGVLPKNVNPGDILSGEQVLNIFTLGTLKYGE